MTGTAPEQLVELRNYHLVPGAAAAFVQHFEDHFLESQEHFGMDIVGQFQIVDDADRFVWVRRYLDPTTRGAALAAFYSSPVWKQFGPRANELMIDVSDVHLLVPHPSAPGFAAGHVPHAERRGRTTAGTGTTVVAALYDLGDGPALPPKAVAEMDATLGDVPGVVELGRLVSARTANDFPALPIHEDVVVAVWLLSDQDRKSVV